ncbi:MAG: hypothetical protein IJT52_04000 [Spirochaetales bacterium]|nr:hypothetical protein [Spirochaetales bacterium]
MAKKKNSKSVIITIIITLIVLAGLTYAGIKYILPNYLNNGADTGFEVYKFAVKIFPLLVGIVLIVIASMVATSRRDEEDEEDKLPPNSYDRQLFEAPSDDPSMDAVKPEDKVPEQAASEVTPEEEKQFVSIFDTPAAEEPAAEEPAAEESAEEPEAVEESAPAPAAVVAAVPAAAPAASGSSDKLVDAIYALVNKLDNMADVITYDEDFDDEDEYEDEEEEETPSDTSALEAKVDKLCDAVATLASLIGSNAVAAQVAPAAAPAQESAAEEPAVEEPAIEEPVAEEPAVEEPVVEEPVAEEPAAVATKTVEVPVEVEVDKVINDADANDPVQRARIEFDSARDGLYDISYAFTSAPLSDVQLSLGEFGDAYEVNGKTMIIVPFLAKEEAVDELDKLGVPYDITTVPAGSDQDFDTAIGAKLQ